MGPVGCCLFACAYVGDGTGMWAIVFVLGVMCSMMTTTRTTTTTTAAAAEKKAMTTTTTTMMMMVLRGAGDLLAAHGEGGLPRGVSAHHRALRRGRGHEDPHQGAHTLHRPHRNPLRHTHTPSSVDPKPSPPHTHPPPLIRNPQRPVPRSSLAATSAPLPASSRPLFSSLPLCRLGRRSAVAVGFMVGGQRHHVHAVVVTCMHVV